MSEVGHPGMSEVEHPGMSEVEHPGMSEVEHPGMSEVEHPGMSTTSPKKTGAFRLFGLIKHGDGCVKYPTACFFFLV